MMKPKVKGRKRIDRRDARDARLTIDCPTLLRLQPDKRIPVTSYQLPRLQTIGYISGGWERW